MMKKAILPLILITGFSFFANATEINFDELSPIQKPQPILEDSIELKGALSGTLKKSNVALIQERVNQAFDDDKMIAFYLSVPYEKRQYLFPMIHTAPYISHKIKSHPEIVFWKNKVPTVIAPRLQAFAKKHLNNLHPYYYKYMDPEFWETLKEEDNKLDTSKLVQEIKPMYLEKGIDYVYPSLREIFKLAGKETSDYLKPTLSVNDLANFSLVMADLDTFEPKGFDKEILFPAIVQMIQKQYYRTFGDPFLMYYYTLEKLNEKETFDAFVQKRGFKDGYDFAIKADKILKGYKAISINLLTAIYIANHKVDRQIKQPTLQDYGQEDIHVMDMYTRMHAIKPADAYFIKQNKEKIENTFKMNFVPQGIMFLVD